MRGLFVWATSADLVDADPTHGVKANAPKSDGFQVWSEEEIAKFEGRWPIGTRERLAFAIYLYSGLRRGDAARLGRQHVSDGVIAIRTEKNGTQVTVPMLPILGEVIAASRTGDLGFIARADGGPMTKESLGNWFREACDAAGVSVQRTGCARQARRGRLITVRRSPSWRRYSDGRAAQWLRTTHAVQTASGSRGTRWGKWQDRTKQEPLFPRNNPCAGMQSK